MALGTSLYTRIAVPSGTLYYVDDAHGSASDANAGTSESLPWKTISKALATLNPGERCQVKNHGSTGYRPTTSGDHVCTRAGTEANPILLENYPGHRPVILPATSSPTRCIRFTTGSAWWILRGFEIKDAIGSANDPCVAGTGTANNIEVSDCWVHDATKGSGFYVANTCTDWHIIGNIVYANDDDAAGQSHGIYVQADDSQILNNVCRDHANGFGIQVRTDSASVPVKRVLICNNTCVRNLGVGSGIASEADLEDCQAWNNIGYDNDNYAIRGFATGTVGTGNIARKNIAFSNTAGTFANQSGADIWDWSGAGGWDSPPGDNLTTDPGMTNPASNDFTLTGSGSADGYGDDAFCPTTDITGATRTVCDVGAYRYVSVLPPVTGQAALTIEFVMVAPAVAAGGLVFLHGDGVGGQSGSVTGSASKTGVVSPLSFTVSRTVIGDNKKFGLVAMPLAATIVTVGTPKLFGRVLLTETFSVTANAANISEVATVFRMRQTSSGSGLRNDHRFRALDVKLGFVSLGISVNRTVIASAKKFGVATLTGTVARTIVGTPTKLGLASQTFTLSRTVVARTKQFGLASMTETFTATPTPKSGVDLRATVSMTAVPTGHRVGQAALTLTLSRAVIGNKKTFGLVAMTETVSRSVIGTRKTFGLAAAPFVLGRAAAGTRKVFGATARTFTVSREVAGQKIKLGAASVGFVVARSAIGNKTTAGIVSPMNLSLSRAVLGTRIALGASELVISVDPIVGGGFLFLGSASMGLAYEGTADGDPTRRGSVSLALNFDPSLEGADVEGWEDEAYDFTYGSLVLDRPRHSGLSQPGVPYAVGNNPPFGNL